MQVQKTLLRAANSLFNLVVFLLLVAALLLFLHNEAEDRQAGESARTAVDKLHLLMGENTPGAPDLTAGMEPGPTEPTEETVPPAHRADGGELRRQRLHWISLHSGV